MSVIFGGFPLRGRSFKVTKLFLEVRSYEAFKQLHLGMAAEIKRKTLLAIAKAVGLKNEQSLLHFLTESPWDVEEIRTETKDNSTNNKRGRNYLSN